MAERNLEPRIRLRRRCLSFRHNRLEKVIDFSKVFWETLRLPGNRAGYLLYASAIYLQGPRQLFKGKKGDKGKGKGKDNGPQPKRAAAPNAGVA